MKAWNNYLIEYNQIYKKKLRHLVTKKFMNYGQILLYIPLLTNISRRKQVRELLWIFQHWNMSLSIFSWCLESFFSICLEACLNHFSIGPLQCSSTSSLAVHAAASSLALACLQLTRTWYVCLAKRPEQTNDLSGKTIVHNLPWKKF